MKDNEIIKALECCYTTGTSCEECPMYNFDECNDVLMAKYVRDLINRQQAEIERLHKAHRLNLLTQLDVAEKIKSEAIKEFAERLKAKANYEEIWTGEEEYVFHTVEFDDIDELVKEMVGDAE